MIRPEAWINRRQATKRPDHETGACQQNQCERDFDREQNAPQPVRPG